MDARSSYLESAGRGANPVQLVVLLYEQTIADLRRAIVALEKGDIPTRTREINHALQVLGHLEATLDQDRGGEVAANLTRFYGQVRAGLVEAHCKQSAAILEQQIAFLMQLREAWCEVERAERAPVVANNVANHPAAQRTEGEPHSFAEWKA